MDKEKEFNEIFSGTIDYPPSITTLDINAFQQAHVTMATTKYHNYIKYFEVYFDLLNIIIQKLNYAPKEKWPAFKGLQYLMYPETIKTLHRAFEDTIYGCYDEATILLRSVFELYVRMIYIEVHPSNLFNIFSVIKGKGNLSIVNFLKDELKTSWQELYRPMSTITHSKAHRILKQYGDLAKGIKTPVALEYAYSETDISMPMNISSFLLYLLFHLTIISFKYDFQPYFTNEEIDRINKTDIVLRRIIEMFPNHFSQWVKDVDKIDNILIAK